MIQYLICIALGIYIEKYCKYKFTHRNFEVIIQTVTGQLYTQELDPWDEWTEHLEKLAEEQERERSIELTGTETKSDNTVQEKTTPTVCEPESKTDKSSENAKGWLW